MTNKKAESEFAKLCARLNIWAHKWSDVRICPRCRTPLFTTKRTLEGDTEGDMGTIVDYLIFIGSQPAWVEVKGKPGHIRMPFSEISEKQRNFLDSWITKGVRCFLFVSLGEGRAPNRKAWLIEWEHYLAYEHNAKHFGQKSMPWTISPGTRGTIAFDQYPMWELEWIQGGWTIPATHVLYQEICDLPALF